MIACIKGREHNEHMLKLRSELQRGNGRLALKLLDEAHKHETDEISDRAAESAVESMCHDISQLGTWPHGLKL